MARRRIRRLNKKLSQLQGQMQGLFGEQPSLGAPYGSPAMVGGNMYAPAAMAGGNMYGRLPGPTGIGGMGDWHQYGQQMFPGMNRWRPDIERPPRRAVDVLPGQRGGGPPSKRDRRRAKRARRDRRGGFDMAAMMQNPVMANAFMQSMGQMWPGLGQSMQSVPGLAQQIFGFDFPQLKYGGGMGGTEGGPGGTGP